MTAKQIENLLSRVALLDYCGNLYEFVGEDGEYFIFQNLNDDSFIKAFV